MTKLSLLVNLWDDLLWTFLPETLHSFAWGEQQLTANRVLESFKAGRRLPEARFTNLKIASKAQPSVYGAFSKAAS